MSPLRVITLEHGGGGRESWELLNELIFSKVPNEFKKTLGGLGIDIPDDGAAIKVGDKYVVLSIDSYTVNPIEFPGGDIGSLAASGSINDVLMMGARPLAIMDSVVVEEGFPIERLSKVMNSFINVALSEGVAVIGGDLKVMPKGSVDGVIITALCVGTASKLIVDTSLRAGDSIIVTGPVAEHGSVIIALQMGYEEFIKDLRSDSRPLTKLMLPLIDRYVDHIRAARDPTRGGIVQILHEWAVATGLTIVIEREKVPLREQVRSFLDMLGIDPLNVASEGVAVLAVDSGIANDVLEFIRGLGFREAEIVGKVIKPPSEIAEGKVLIKTEVGGLTIAEPQASPVPRIC